VADIQLGPGRLYIEGASGWVDIGATEGGVQFQLDPVAEASCSLFPLSLAGLTLTAHGTDPDGRLFHFMTADLPARWHRRHCRWCNPAAFAPRCPYGREYHRRQLARKRRRRR
jgi:hypothetical protein